MGFKEYKNEAEKLISQISFEREPGEDSEVTQFKDEVRFAQLDRYNRVMKVCFLSDSTFSTWFFSR